jgi:hypothetical protein|tara:strand:- start:2709 stop:3017 length:309 start_codon:yes stop_codon:yes gene_type:complete
MNRFIPIIFVIVTASSVNHVFADEYDLSDHPVYNWVWNEDINFSNETYSKPAVSNEYTLAYSMSILNVDFDPTHIYYEKPSAEYDHCAMEQFIKYPKCRSTK